MEHIVAFNKALAEAQAKLTDPKHNREVDMTLKSGRRVKYTYADHKACMDEFRKVFPACGFSLSQTTLLNDGRLCLVTELRHAMGHAERSLIPVPADGSMQDLGGNLTYLKRYQLTAIIGLATDADMDGDHATDEKPKAVDKKSYAQSETKYPEYPFNWKMSEGHHKGKELGDIPLEELARMEQHGATMTNLTKAQEATLKAIRVAVSKKRSEKPEQDDFAGAGDIPF